MHSLFPERELNVKNNLMYKLNYILYYRLIFICVVKSNISLLYFLPTTVESQNNLYRWKQIKVAVDDDDGSIDAQRT